MGTLWSRVWATEQAWDVGNIPIAILNPGETLARVHFGFRFTGVTSNEQDMRALADDFLAFGVVTQNSATGPTPPNALTQALDQNPPLERWVWWGTTQMRPAVYGSEHPDVVIWCTDMTAIVGDTQGQVKANITAGQQVTAYLTWAPWTTTGWKVRGNVTGQMWASSLVLTV